MVAFTDVAYGSARGKSLGSEVPEVKKPPSEYIREHCWFTTQPIEEPSQGKFFHQMLDAIAMPNRIMFATDYPHWDFDAPDQAFPVKINAELHRKIMVENALSLYKFDE